MESLSARTWWIAGPDTTIEFYANKEVPDELRDLEIQLDELSRDKQHITGITGKFSTGGGGDARFRKMMTDFVKTRFNKNATTVDFQRAVEKHMTAQMDVDKNGTMDWIFNGWV